MNTKMLASIALLALVLSATAQAVHLDPGGRGQVLIYPYYTVNKQQQTLVSVTNTSSAAQAVKVRIKEGRNNRDVLSFNVFLSPFDSWAGTIFALRDAGLPRDGAGLLSNDTSCTHPQFGTDPDVVNGQPFLELKYDPTSFPDDGGPYSADRSHEGYLEIIAMASLAAPFDGHVAHGSNGSPPTGCAQARGLTGSELQLSMPSGGLTGSVSIVDVGRGTYLSARAEALGGFTHASLFTSVPHMEPNLASVNDGASGPLSSFATAVIPGADGGVIRYTVPGPHPESRRVDAVSAVLMADNLYNEFQISTALAAGSDWVVTFPTKGFYVDPGYSLTLYSGTAVPPFEAIYAGSLGSPVHYSFVQNDRQGAIRQNGYCNPCFGVPPPPPILSMDYAVNVLDFRGPAAGPSAVLGSRLNEPVRPYIDAGWMRLLLDHASGRHALLASQDGQVMRGLPVIGFWASNIVNNSVSAGVLANYAAAVRHATTVTCVRGNSSSCAED